MRTLVLDRESQADVVGFESLRVAVKAVEDLPAAGWRVVGGWMVRAWVEGGAASELARPTIDVDLTLFPIRGRPAIERVPDRLLEEGLRPHEEPFRLRREDGIRLDLLVPPGASRGDPPRIGRQVLFRAEGTAFGFALPPEPVTARLKRRKVEFQVPRLGAALVHKTLVLAAMRPRYLDDASDVARLLHTVRHEPGDAIPDLVEHRRRSDARKALRALSGLFGDEEARGARWVEQELGTRAAVTAVDDARWLRSEMA